MHKARAYAPSHITGFFEILDRAKELLERGSRGAGISLSKGVETDIAVSPSKKSRISVRLNGVLRDDALVSEYVIRRYLNLVRDKYSVKVDHNTAVPVGSGFGTSGAGALSLSIAMNEALETGLSPIEAAQIAHEADVENKTGLGTVIAEQYGGIEVRLKPGAPGVGRIMNIPYDADMSICAFTYGPMSTTHVLSTPWMRDRINGHASELLWKLVEKPSPMELVGLSRRFADGVHLMSPRVSRILSMLDENDTPASMLMMGEGAFAMFDSTELAREMISSIKREIPSVTVLTSHVAREGAKLIDS